MEETPISDIRYPPGIRFHPSDEELISYYLQRKVNSLPLPKNVITDIQLYSYNPWDLPRKALFGEDEWYFFTPRDRKYPNGGRPNRTAVSGYWKATGIDKPILNSTGSRRIGVKKALVFYKGKPPNGIKMNWVMVEYRLPDTSRPLRSNGSMRLDDWVLCRVRQKGNMSKNIAQEDDRNSCEFRECLLENKELPTVLCAQDGRDMLADYLLSSECHLIASLLVGHDPRVLTIPGTICGEIIMSEKMNTQENFSDAVPNVQPIEQNDTTSNSYCHVNEENKFNLNAYINMKELDIPALLSDNFLQ